MSAGKPVTVREIVSLGTSKLVKFSDTARLDAEILVAHALRFDKARLIVEGERSVSSGEVNTIEQLFNRRISQEPVAYIVGRKGFWDGDFRVSPAVLVPRPETELLVEESCARLTKVENPVILDLGTGSGCIAISIATTLLGRRCSPRLLAVDASEDALDVARQNAAEAGVSHVIEFRKSDWFSSVLESEGAFDCIVSNPPYVPEGDLRMSPETAFEPAGALFAGDDGLSDLRTIISEAGRFLKPSGFLVCEFGMGQEVPLKEFMKTEALWGSPAGVRTDLAGIPRALIIEKLKGGSHGG